LKAPRFTGRKAKIRKQKKKAAKNKKPFLESIANRVSEAADLFGTLVQRPREFPAALLVLGKRFARNIWDVRGGGLYASGYVLTLAWLEIKMLYQDLADLFGPGDLFSDSLIRDILSFVLQFFLDSLVNSIRAFAWPAGVIDIYPPWGLIVLVGLFIVFPKYIKPPLERWLFDGD